MNSLLGKIKSDISSGIIKKEEEQKELKMEEVQIKRKKTKSEEKKKEQKKTISQENKEEISKSKPIEKKEVKSSPPIIDIAKVKAKISPPKPIVQAKQTVSPIPAKPVVPQPSPLQYQLIPSSFLKKLESSESTTSTLLSNLMKKVDMLQNLTNRSFVIPQSPIVNNSKILEEKKERFKEKPKNLSVSDDMDDLMDRIDDDDAESVIKVDLDWFLGKIAGMSESNKTVYSSVSSLNEQILSYVCDSKSIDDNTIMDNLAEIIYLFSSKLNLLKNSNYDDLMRSQFGNILKSFLEIRKSTQFFLSDIVFRTQMLTYYTQEQLFDLNPKDAKEILQEIEKGNRDLMRTYFQISRSEVKCKK